MNKSMHIGTFAAIAILGAALVVAGCGSGSSSTDNTVTVNGDVPLAYVKRATSVGMNPTDAANRSVSCASNGVAACS